MTVAHINRIGTAVPDHDIHEAFIAFARDLLPDDRTRGLFDRMAQRSGIAHRYAGLRPGNLAAGEVDADGFYRRGRFPGTAVASDDDVTLELSCRQLHWFERASWFSPSLPDPS